MSETEYSKWVIDAIHKHFTFCRGPAYIKILADRPLNHGHLYVVFVRRGRHQLLRYQCQVTIDEHGVVRTVDGSFLLLRGDQR